MLKKFVEEFNVTDWEIETDDGWVDIKSTNKTIPYKVWRVITKNKCEVMCADRHIVFNEQYDEVFVKDLNIGDKIITKDGPSEVVLVEETDEEDNMYDLELADNSKHRYFCSRR